MFSSIARQTICPKCRHKARLFSTQQPTTSHSEPRTRPSRSIILDSPIYNPTSFPGYFGQERKRPLRKHRRAIEYENIEKSEKEDNHDPWMRMSNSPKRMCIVTRQSLPSAFLVGLQPTYCPSSVETGVSESLQLLPTQVASPDKNKRGKGMYVTCHKEHINALVNSKGPHIGVLGQIGGLQIPPSLADIIEAQLGYRVLYELRHLYRQLRALPRMQNPSLDRQHGDRDQPAEKILRWLSKDEVEHARKGAQIEGKGIIALLAIPTIPALSSSIDLQDLPIPTTFPPAAPNIQLLSSEIPNGLGTIQPLYDLSSLISPDLHSHLYTLLDGIYSLERDRLCLTDADGERSGILALSVSAPRRECKRKQLDRKAVMLLGIALWRLACFHGHGWYQEASS
ncbi:uncharacterized protein L203_101302 [Cryptococcus depauperatus CBS 7841]|uniref:Uncharacterized protein n=1 Tax=Cryptococcus depauperatus CBS 7841 TaxID=1295531 RepID=A0AAJ8JPU0_9TREE